MGLDKFDTEVLRLVCVGADELLRKLERVIGLLHSVDASPEN
jgi:hypothetical protein